MILHEFRSGILRYRRSGQHMAHAGARSTCLSPRGACAHNIFVETADIAGHRDHTIILQSASSDCAKELDGVMQGGSLTLNGETPLQLGITKWRTLVTYVPQTRVHPGGTPAEFYFAAQVLDRPF